MKLARLDWRFAGALLLLVATLSASKLSETRKSDHLGSPLATVPMDLGGWAARSEDRFAEGTETLLKADEYLTRSYRRGEKDIDLMIIYYAQQKAGETMHSPKHCLPGSGWEIWESTTVQVPVNGVNVSINRARIRRALETRQVLYWYQLRDRIIAGELRGKLVLLQNAIFNGYTAGSMVRLVLKDDDQTLADGLDFSRKLIPEVQRCFGKSTSPAL